MKVAMPVFGTRVSPHFDYAPCINVFTLDNGRKVQERSEIVTTNWPPIKRVEHISGLGVGVVICGGISWFSERMLISRGIKVYSWVTGEAEHAINTFFRGELESRSMVGPKGCCGRWQFMGGRGPRRSGPPRTR